MTVAMCASRSRSSVISALVVTAVAASFAFEAKAQEQEDAGSEVEREPLVFHYEPFTDLVIPEAEGEERLELAQALAAQAVENLAADQSETAARQLEAAYALHPDLALLLPLGRAYSRLGHYRAAVERLETYLERYSGLSAEGRGEAQALLERCQRQFSEVSISTAPPGAQFSIDGSLLGETPLDEPIELAVGEYAVSATLAGYHEAAETLEVPGGEPMELLLRLRPLTQRAPRGLSIGLWTSVGVLAASAVMMAVSFVVAVQRTEELQAARFPTTEMNQAARSWWTVSWVTAGITGASTLSAILFGLSRSRQMRTNEGEGESGAP